MVVFMSACPGESAITRKGSLASSLAVAPALRKLCDVMPSDIPSARRRRRQSVSAFVGSWGVQLADGKTNLLKGFSPTHAQVCQG